MSFVELIRETASFASKLNNAELNNMLISLQTQAIEIQTKSLEYRERILELENEIKRLKEAETIEETDIVFDTRNPFFTLKSEGNATRYCTNCWREHHQKIQLSNSIGGMTKCNKCGNMFW